MVRTRWPAPGRDNRTSRAQTFSYRRQLILNELSMMMADGCDVSPVALMSTPPWYFCTADGPPRWIVIYRWPTAPHQCLIARNIKRRKRLECSIGKETPMILNVWNKGQFRNISFRLDLNITVGIFIINKWPSYHNKPLPNIWYLWLAKVTETFD